MRAKAIGDAGVSPVLYFLKGGDFVVDSEHENKEPDINPNDYPELPIFRLIANEFSSLPDDYICQWIALARPATSRRIYRRIYQHAVARRTAHYLAMAQKTQNEADGNIPFSSISGENASASFAINTVNLALDDALLRESKHGLWLLANRQPGVWS